MQERRADLIATALRLFRSQPFNTVSTEEVARAAGVSQSLIFHYFPTKADLYIAAFEEELETLWRSVSEANRQSEQPVERLLAALNAYFDYAQARGDHYVGMLRGGPEAHVDGKVLSMIVALRDRLVDMTLHELSAIAPEGSLGEARLLRAGLRGWLGFVQELALDWLDHRDSSREELVEASVRVLAAAIPQLEEAIGDADDFPADRGDSPS